MKKSLPLVAGVIALALLAGCAAPNQGGQQLTPAQSAVQAATKLCAVMQPTAQNMQLQMPLIKPPLDLDTQAKVNQVVAQVDNFCKNVALADAASNQALLNTVFPVAMSIISHSNMDDNTRSMVLLSLTGVQTAASLILAQQQAQVTAAVPKAAAQ